MAGRHAVASTRHCVRAFQAAFAFERFGGHHVLSVSGVQFSATDGHFEEPIVVATGQAHSLMLVVVSNDELPRGPFERFKPAV